ncbi:hypothetical protein OAR96_01605 [Euryarchaeota archaeon]|nr:hypothetical protein [Euryarchaeota archaeon]MDC0962793.1 hypothetical protein [Euryarchaeota archaeon]
MNKTRYCSFLMVSLFLLSICSMSVNADNENEINEDNFSSLISGYSKFIIHDDIITNSQFNSTWEFSITLSDQIGTDLLENPELGLRAQIDIHLGNSDGLINLEESNDFDDLFRLQRNWTDSEIGGCCIFDYNQLYASAGIELITYPVVLGSIELNNTEWGWDESANLIGQTDNRITRILDFPRTGSLIEEIPLQVILPSDWEYTYSAMEEIFEGDPGIFFVNRNESNVASNIRVTISPNQPPIASGYRTSSGSMIALNSSTNYYGDCEDSSLDINQQWWTLSNNGTLVKTHYGDTFSFIPENYDFYGGQVASVVMHCKDWFNSTNTWYENIVIDSVFPTWDSVISYVNEFGQTIILDSNQDIIRIRSDTYLSFSISANDYNSQLPTDIKIISNKTPNYLHKNKDNLNFSDIFYQNEDVNGMHLNLSERHKSKDQTSWSINLSVSDNAGNTLNREWIILVLDGSGPTIVPDLIINNNSISSTNLARNGDSIIISLSQSFDDLDSIENTLWSLTIDDEIIVENVTMELIDKKTLGPFTSGTHVFSIDSYDSSGNHRNLAFGLAISPNLGIDIEILSSSHQGRLVEGETVLFSATMQNMGASAASGQFCVNNQCGPFIGVPGATSSGPGTFNAELNFKLTSTEITTYFQWSSESANQSGTLDINSDITVEPYWQSPIRTVLLVFIVLSFIVFFSNRLWGIDSQKP